MGECGRERVGSEGSQSSYSSSYNTRGQHPTIYHHSANISTYRGPEMTPLIHSLMEKPEYFFHVGQQSAKMNDENSQRMKLSFELKRRADIEHSRRKGIEPRKLPMYPLQPDRVTLTMEINYQDYEEMFTKKTMCNTRESIASIMHDTDTIIQFPDRNLPMIAYNSPDQRVEKMHPDLIHQVTITGKLENVEKARLRLRRFCVVSVMFPVMDTRSELPISAIPGWLKERITDRTLCYPQLTIQLLPPKLSFMCNGPSIRISGRIGDEMEMIKACEQLRYLMFDKQVADKMTFSSFLEVPTSQRSLIVGSPDATQLLTISQHSNALLHFPAGTDESNPTVYFYITGTSGAVLKARHFMQGLQPVQLCFDVNNSDLHVPIDNQNRIIHVYENSLRVSVDVVPSDMEPTVMLQEDETRHHISLQTNEYNICALYAVMRRIIRRDIHLPDLQPTDYHDIFPLVPYLTKSAVEVNMRCRISPKPHHLPYMQHSPFHSNPYYNHFTPAETAHAQESPIHHDMIAQNHYRQDYGVQELEPRIPTMNGRHSPSDRKEFDIDGENEYPHTNSYDPNHHISRYNGEKDEYSTISRNSSRSRQSSREKRNNSQLRNGRYGSIANQQKHQLALKPKDFMIYDERYYYANSMDFSGPSRRDIEESRSERRRSPYKKDNSKERNNTDRIREKEQSRLDDYGYFGRSHSFTKTVLTRARTPPKSSEKVELKHRATVNVHREVDNKDGTDITRRMNVMDLIMLASEDPQSELRNRELRGDNVDRREVITDDQEHRTYAQILEGKRISDESEKNSSTRRSYSSVCLSSSSQPSDIPLPSCVDE